MGLSLDGRRTDGCVPLYNRSYFDAVLVHGELFQFSRLILLPLLLLHSIHRKQSRTYVFMEQCRSSLPICPILLEQIMFNYALCCVNKKVANSMFGEILSKIWSASVIFSRERHVILSQPATHSRECGLGRGLKDVLIIIRTPRTWAELRNRSRDCRFV